MVWLGIAFLLIIALGCVLREMRDAAGDRDWFAVMLFLFFVGLWTILGGGYIVLLSTRG